MFDVIIIGLKYCGYDFVCVIKLVVLFEYSLLNRNLIFLCIREFYMLLRCSRIDCDSSERMFSICDIGVDVEICVLCFCGGEFF